MEQSELRRYFTKDLRWGESHQTDLVFDFLMEAADFAKGGAVLDAGAGAQRYKPFFHRSHYIAQEHPVAGQQNKGLQVFDILCDVRTIPLKDNSVDLVLSTSSLEHMEYPENFFAEAHRVLRPGGALFVHVPFAYEVHEIPFDFQRPTRYGLERYYRHAGFDRMDVAPGSSSVYAGQHLFRRAVREDAKRLGSSPWAKLREGLIRLLALLVSKLAMAMLDAKPTKDTRLPIGWLARGYKSGTHEAPVAYETKAEFIQNSANPENDMVVQEGKILPRETKAPISGVQSLI